MIYGKVTEKDGQIVSVAFAPVEETAGEFVILTELPDLPSEIVDAIVPPTPLQRHERLLDLLPRLLARALYESPDAYEAVSLIASEKLAQDVANLQPVLEPVAANASHPLGIVRAIHSQAASEWFPGTKIERQIAATHFLFRALGKVSTANYEAEALLFRTGVEALKDAVALELETEAAR